MKRKAICTQDELAELAGVTRVTVNRALSGHPSVNPETRKRVRELALKRGYRPNAMARAMVNRRSNIVGIVLVNTVIRGMELNNQHWFELIMGADVALREAGYIPALIGVDDLCPPEASESRAIPVRLADGVLVLGNLPKETDQRLADAIGEPLIRIERNEWETSGCIRRDEAAAGRMVAEHLMNAGRGSLVWIGNSEPWRLMHFSDIERRDGFMEAAAKAGRKVREILLTRSTPESGYIEVCQALKKKNGIGCSDAVLARRFVDAAMKIGVIPGRDFGIACCDDSQMIRQFFPQLSRVSFDRYTMGRQAAEMLVTLIETPKAPCPSRKPTDSFIPGSTL